MDINPEIRTFANRLMKVHEKNPFVIDLLSVALESDQPNITKIENFLATAKVSRKDITEATRALGRYLPDNYSLWFGPLIYHYNNEPLSPLFSSQAFQEGVLPGLFLAVAEVGVRDDQGYFIEKIVKLITKGSSFFKDVTELDSSLAGDLENAVRCYAILPVNHQEVDKIINSVVEIVSFRSDFDQKLDAVGELILNTLVSTRFRRLGTWPRALRMSNLNLFVFEAKNKKRIYLSFHVNRYAAMRQVEEKYPDEGELKTVLEEPLWPGRAFKI
jgi:hypothetical protein